METTIFALFSTLTDKLGITQEWLNGTAVNVMTFTGIVRAKFPQVAGFWPTTAVVAAATLGLAAAQYYTSPLNIGVCIVLVWAGTTLLMKGGEKGVDVAVPNRFRGGKPDAGV